jgi:hypothetical protein
MSMARALGLSEIFPAPASTDLGQLKRPCLKAFGQDPYTAAVPVEDLEAVAAAV